MSHFLALGSGKKLRSWREKKEGTGKNLDKLSDNGFKKSRTGKQT